MYLTQYKNQPKTMRQTSIQNSYDTTWTVWKIVTRSVLLKFVCFLDQQQTYSL